VHTFQAAKQNGTAGLGLRAHSLWEGKLKGRAHYRRDKSQNAGLIGVATVTIYRHIL
jgi:hypothetical protein